MQALSGNAVHRELLDETAEAAMGHIELARWADLVLVAPASADFIARLAHGLADDLLATLCLATDAPVLVAPAMNQAMWRDPATQHNCRLLAERDVGLVGPGSGAQACGDTGPGRMLEPAELLGAVADRFAPGALDGVRVMVTAGPTREALDPVRYISNHSSGKMGFALAEVAWERGAEVVLVSGPTQLPVPTGVECVRIETTKEMEAAVRAALPASDVLLMAAAPSDYRPEEPLLEKRPRQQGRLAVDFGPTEDILLATEGARKAGSVIVGFALETGDAMRKGRAKLERKHLDFIVVNDALEPGAGFEVDTNRVVIVSQEGVEVPVPMASKRVVAEAILDAVEARLGR